MFKRWDPSAYEHSVFTIDYQKLYQKGYRGIIFDIDNTLVHHGDDSTAEVDRLFEYIHGLGIKTLLLSNNSEARIQKFNENIHTLYISNADKPATTNYFKAISMLELEKAQVVCVGDQLFTDIYGANQSGIDSILVDFIRLPEEKKIGKKRILEKWILWFYMHDHLCKNKIGDIHKEEII